jgi:hypothetical protein
MKLWQTLAVAAVGLAYALYFQLGLRTPHIKPPIVASAPEARQAAAPRPKPAPRSTAPERRLSFGGYPCLRDCGEDQAGYRWASENHLTDPDDCTGKTGPFIEGCRVYARQQLARRVRY